MNSAPAPAKSPFDAIRVALGIGGLLALIVGILVLVWPAKTAMVVAAIIAIYAIIAGIVYAAVGLMSKAKGGWSRFGNVLLGVVFVVAGIVAFASLGQTAEWLAVFIAVMIGIMWIVEGVVAFTSLSGGGAKIWTILFAVLSIVAGIVLLFAPLWGAAVLWMLMGISLAILGAMNIVRAFALGRRIA